ncbi:MAG: DUF559 domain-containing protein [Rhizobiales bacterium]|nr:DUF559 domain-containing protein [Hyphomicrobiales bacterium]
MRAPERIIHRARRLRRKLTVPEARLWSCYADGLPDNQYSADSTRPYVLDFYRAKAKLADEIDGITHNMADRPHRDEKREAWLTK